MDRHRPWGISPVSLLEVQFLHEVGRVKVRQPDFTNALRGDPRFLLDDIPVEAIVRHALPLSWTRDPFDRLLAAHSTSRRIPLCSVDEAITAHHAFLPAELGTA